MVIDNMKPFSLYDEDIRTVTGTSTVFTDQSDDNDKLLEVDLSEPQTLYSMSSKVREVLKDKPEDYQLTLYLVCGNVPSKDSGLFADYLKDVTQPVLVAFRGIVHFDFIHLFLDRVVYVNPTAQIRYSKEKLHDTLKNLLAKPDSYKRFMQRFVDEYWRLNEGNMMPITELGSLGIKTEILQ